MEWLFMCLSPFLKQQKMKSKELEQMVARECEFLSYYLEEYQKKLTTEPNNTDLKEMIIALEAKWEAYDKVYRYIKKVLPKDED
jgi:hypothetical protein